MLEALAHLRRAAARAAVGGRRGRAAVAGARPLGRGSTSSGPPRGPPRWPPGPPPWPAGPASPSRAGSRPARSWRACWRWSAHGRGILLNPAHDRPRTGIHRFQPPMSVLKTLESKLAGLVEGTFSRAFRSEVRPVEIARKLAREMDEHRVQSLSRVYAPNEYAVWLSPEDRKQFEGYEDELKRELAGYLLEHARREKISLATRPAIEFRTDDELRLGEFGIQARLVKPPERAEEPPSQGDHGHTMVYTVSERLAEPLREPDPRRGSARLRVGGRTELLGSGGARASAARATPTSSSTIPTSRAGTPRSGRRAAPGSSATSARPTASRSTGGESRARSRSRPATRSSSAPPASRSSWSSAWPSTRSPWRSSSASSPSSTCSCSGWRAPRSRTCGAARPSRVRGRHRHAPRHGRPERGQRGRAAAAGGQRRRPARGIRLRPLRRRPAGPRRLGRHPARRTRSPPPRTPGSSRRAR